jgi:glucokinase
VACAAHEGDVGAREILWEAATYLGRALVNFLYAYDPGLVVLGGGVSQSEVFFGMVREAVDAEPTMLVFRDVPLRRAEFGERSVVHGARTLAERLARKGFAR